jgi:hypothetical protein
MRETNPIKRQIGPFDSNPNHPNLDESLLKQYKEDLEENKQMLNHFRKLFANISDTEGLIKIKENLVQLKKDNVLI